MAFKTFTQRRVSTGETEQRPFTPEHFQSMGVAYTPAAGMPLLESYQLVNQWNQSQPLPSYVYGLEAR